MRRLPLIAPRPPRLSEHPDVLRRIEASGVFSNNGPEVQAFEREAAARLFGGGACLAVANATSGLMIAIREAAAMRPAAGTMALMPAFTFAATAQAAHWAGLVPLIADVDPDDWSMAAAAEERLLHQHGGRIGVIVPYATFGAAIDLDRYAWLSRRHGVGIVVDAAGSLGTQDAAGQPFGAGQPFATVFSLHATKSFAVAEGGLIHCVDPARIARLRAMAGFGFGEARSATMPGLNAKMPELLAALARLRLADFEAVVTHRAALEAAYGAALRGVSIQRVTGRRRALQVMPVRLPDRLAPCRDAIRAQMLAEGVETGCYFSPHLGEQPFLRSIADRTPTPVADRLAAAILSLPITDAMTVDDARHAAATLMRACAAAGRPAAVPRAGPPAVAATLIVGGGPAGTAVLTAAAKQGRLPDLARGLVLVERGDTLGDGRLGDHAIGSDSTAATFLSAVKGSPHPDLAALTDHPVGRAVAQYGDGAAVPLPVAAALLRETGARLGDHVRHHGGHVLTGHEAVEAQRTRDGLWAVRLRRGDGRTITRRARHLVIATGGHQPLERLAAQTVAGASLVALAGDRLIQSGTVLATDGFAKVAARLAGRHAPRIAVIGGSTSAVTSVLRLLRGAPALALGAGAITLLHRRPLRPFYPSAAAALAEGFTDFGADDICPVSGFVYRLAGLRLDARELVLRMLSVDGRAPDPRVALHRIADGEDRRAQALIAEADLVIAALGYRPQALPLRDADGAPIRLRDAAMVDGHGRVIDAAGTALLGLYGIGLAAGFVPSGAMGGEASFRGQANGLWQWQNDAGAMIVEAILAQRRQRAA